MENFTGPFQSSGCRLRFVVRTDSLDALFGSSIRLFVLTRPESGAAFLAKVYGRLTGKASVCLSTSTVWWEELLRASITRCNIRLNGCGRFRLVVRAERFVNKVVNSMSTERFPVPRVTFFSRHS